MTTNELRENLRTSLNELRSIRDDVRLRMHLASMDVKDLWNQIEPRFETAERDLAAAADGALVDVERSLEWLRKTLTDMKNRLEKRRN